MLCSHILIDASNLAYRAEAGYGSDHGNSTKSGRKNSLVRGFMSMLGNLRSCTSGAMPVIVWEGGYDHRTKLSKKGVELGIVPSTYKANRGKPDPIKDSIHDQMPDLRAILAATDIPQVRVNGYEADDVIASYIKKIVDSGGCAMSYTVDKDYYQSIGESSIIMRREDLVGLPQFVEVYGIQPSQWIDVGALAGDDGDNIHGVPGVGEGTALNMIKAHGDYESVIAACVSELSPLRAEYPDIEDEDNLAKLIDYKAHMKTNKYAGCYVGMPFTGVAMAIEKKLVRNVKVSTLMVSMYQQRVRLAYRLKRMVDDIVLPDLRVFNRFDENEFEAICNRFEVNDLLNIKSAFSCQDVVSS